MSYIIATLALYGTWLNVQKNKKCFYIWSLTNGFWAIYDFSFGLYAQGLLFTAYFGLAVVGIIKWKKE